MTTLELLGTLGTILGGGGALGVWLRGRADRSVAREAGAAEVVDDLLGEVRGQRAEMRELRDRVESEAQARRDGEGECRRMLEQAEAACDERQRQAVDQVRRDLLRVASRVRRSLPDDEVTARTELAQIERRSAPSLPAVRLEPKVRRREGDDR